MSQHGFESGVMWNTYLEMESRFLEYLDYVPFASAHRKVYSSKLLRLMLQIGGYIDTAFKEMVFYEKFDTNEACRNMRKKVLKNKTVTIDESLAAFEPIYRLSQRTVLVKSVEHFTSPPLLLERFAPFAITESTKYLRGGAPTTQLNTTWSRISKRQMWRIL